MISNQNFIDQSLALNLFFLRIMKEHSIFLEASFVAKNTNLIHQASSFKNQFTKLLSRAITLSEGVISLSAIGANEIVTQYTLEAEKATQFGTGIFIDSNLTLREKALTSTTNSKNVTSLSEHVYSLNSQILRAIHMLINFKANLLNDVLSCKVFTSSYPLLIDHILREALLFQNLLSRLQNGTEVDMKRDLLEQETFWNRIMSEHAFFIRGLLDPTEVDLFDIANQFGKEFETLQKESAAVDQATFDPCLLANNTLKSTIEIRDFKAQATDGLINCKIKSIIVPLLADHVLREANHYINLLDTCKGM